MTKTSHKGIKSSWKSNKGKDNKSNGSKKNNNNQNNKSASLKLCPHSASKQQSIAHDTAKDHMTNQVQQKLNQVMDAVKSLRDSQMTNPNVEKPKRALRVLVKDEGKAIE